MLKNQKGITLVALVITIIVLLILATAAITMAVGSDGLFQKAATAVNEHNNKVEEEGEYVNNAMNFLDQYWDEYSTP